MMGDHRPFERGQNGDIDGGGDDGGGSIAVEDRDLFGHQIERLGARVTLFHGRQDMGRRWLPE